MAILQMAIICSDKFKLTMLKKEAEMAWTVKLRDDLKTSLQLMVVKNLLNFLKIINQK